MRYTSRIRWALFALCCFAPGLFAGDAPGGYHSDEAWGYKVRTPQGWTEAALSADENWIASKFLGKRELEAKNSQYWTRETPEMWVIGFPHARKEEVGARKVDRGDYDEIQFDAPYKDYKDFIKRNKNFLSWEGGGYFFSKEEETEIGGVPVTQYEIKMEQMVNTPRRVVAWVYHFEDIDFAIQFKIIEDYFPEFESGFEGCMKTLKRVKRTKALPGASRTGSKIVEEIDIDRLPPEERKKALKEAVERKFKREEEALPKDWKIKRTKNYLVLYNSSDKFMNQMMSHVEVVRDHIEDLFGGVGADYVPPGIVRIFASDVEQSAYHSSTSNPWGIVRELSIVEGHGWEKDNAYESINRGIFSQWLYYRNKLLDQNMPGWLSSGLDKYFQMVRTKGRRITFSNEDWGRDQMRLSIKKGEYVPLRDLLSSGVWDAAEASGNEAEVISGWQRHSQAQSVVYWLMTEGNRGKYKGIVRDYLSTLIVIVEEAEAEYQAKMAKIKAEEEAAKMAAEEKAKEIDDESEEIAEGEFDAGKRWEEMAKAFKEKRAEILTQSFERAFTGWDDRDWERFTKAWVNHAD
ncbi:MAG: hypothetical protein HC813_00180 [Planctomycetes bacterium]|nr:hypothetical protein [Planctomycetota bacterium]